MNSEILVGAVGEHMKVLQEMFTWALIVALGVAWAGLQGGSKIKVGELTFNRKRAFYVVAALYFGVTVAGIVMLLRLEALLRLLPDPDFVNGYTKLASFEWVMNPFCYLGTSAAARQSALWGTGLLIVGWWLCLASVWTLRGDEPLGKSLLLPFVFYLAGLYSLDVIWDIYKVNLSRLEVLSPELFNGLKETAIGRWVVICLATVAGAILFASVLKLSWVLKKVARESAGIEHKTKRSKNGAPSG